MKILIYGAGVIGSIFAAKLFLSGQDVTVLARGKRLEEITNAGIVICNPKTKDKEIAKVKVIDRLTPEMKFDYIFVVMQRVQVDSVLEALSGNCTQNMVFVVNTAAGYEKWKSTLGPERLMIGFPSAGGERKDGIVNYFIGKGFMRAFQTTTFGEINGKKTQRVANIIEMFNNAGIPSVFCSDMDAWQKTHVAMVTGIGNALYGHNCENRRLAASWGDLKNMVLAVKEGFAVLKQLGVKPTPWKLKFFHLPVRVLALVFKVIIKTQLAEITMAKHCMAAKAEMEFLQEEFDLLIEKTGMKTPNIDSLKQNLIPMK